ncbi:hypothetical protein IWQ62_003147 [Dispira parvispora]|uniref:Uncharacterized protein n=1 Tax=Dispira parvispora TaxID=1520584 RepID=A0A9W8E365_9FUNG|nr:hypothetical protein IWQ62_003147 [Dispira parvispora]
MVIRVKQRHMATVRTAFRAPLLLCTSVRQQRRYRFGIYRTDTHGNQFWLPNTFSTHDEAMRQVKQLEALGHHQSYYVRKLSSTESTTICSPTQNLENRLESTDSASPTVTPVKK